MRKGKGSKQDSEVRVREGMEKREDGCGERGEGGGSGLGGKGDDIVGKKGKEGRRGKRGTDRERIKERMGGREGGGVIYVAWQIT